MANLHPSAIIDKLHIKSVDSVKDHNRLKNKVESAALKDELERKGNGSQKSSVESGDKHEECTKTSRLQILVDLNRVRNNHFNPFALRRSYSI